MSKLSSVNKGDELEKQVYNLIKSLVENGEFFVNRKSSNVYWKKGYYSAARQSDIIFDITIESFLKGAEKYSSLIVIECKHYNKPVPVDDIEEFCSKLNQIGEHNTKGIFITNSSFQRGALNVAVSKGIGLARLAGKDELEWINYRKQKDLPKYSKEVTEQQLANVKAEKHFYSFFKERTFDNLPELLIGLEAIDLYIHKQKFIKIPFKSEQDIERMLSEWPSHLFYESGKVHFDDLCALLSEIYDVDFDFESVLGYAGHNKVLGKITFNPLKISITRDLKPENLRWRFTLAHEIGHLALHYYLLNEYVNENIDTETTFSLHEDFSHNVNKRLEIQANLFASHLLLPTTYLRKTVSRYFLKERIYKGYLYLDSQPVNQQLVFTLLKEIQQRYEVSIEVAKLRLISQGWLKDDTDKSVFRILKEMKM